MTNSRKKRRLCAGILAFVLAGLWKCAPVWGADVLAFVKENQESQIYPIDDGSGKYLIKSSGFYCAGQNGHLHNEPAVHYFDRMEINGTVFSGYYYHDNDGIFHAGNDRLLYLSSLNCGDLAFDGFYMAGNLGKLTAAPQVRYLENLVVHDNSFQGYYYFNEYGRLMREPGIYPLDMDENGIQFRGNYYFGGVNGALVQKAGTTPEGFPVNENGRVESMQGERMEALHETLEAMIPNYDGEWSIYVKNLNTEEKFSINSRPMTSASLIKTFIMAKTYSDLESVRANEAVRISASPAGTETAEAVEELLWNMITVSDNESSNELVRLQTPSGSFSDGARNVNEYLAEEGYADTSVQHTLHPSASQEEGLGGSNITSVTDCGKLLEKIYKGTCVSAGASEKMKNLLMNQETDWKIPAGIVKGVTIANKTGETDQNQHDIAIVYGPVAKYILCVMTEGCPDEGDAIEGIRNISRTVYNCLNLYEYENTAE